MTFDPMSVEVTCVTLPKDHCVQVPWQYINVCGYSDQFCKIPHTYILHTTYILYTYYVHTTYRMSDHIVSYWTQFRRALTELSSGETKTEISLKLDGLWGGGDTHKKWNRYWYRASVFAPRGIGWEKNCINMGSLSERLHFGPKLWGI